MPRVIDGGLATELEGRGLDLSGTLWSARLLLSQPATIRDVHLAYFRAGATVATTASYQATVPGFAAAGFDRGTALDLIRRSVILAREAREAFELERNASPEATEAVPLLVAGSIGPYGAMLADGSEYRGDYDPGRDGLRDVHLPRMEALLEAGADLLAIETIPTVREAAVLVEALDELGATGWLTYQCRDARSTAAGEPIQEAAALAAGRPGVVAVGVNCTAPRYVPELLARMRAVTSADLIGYPNAGDRWDPATHRWDATDAEGTFRPETMAALATDETVGAAWLGGCCGVGPAEIRRLVAALA